jgi:type I restriction enzyme S subunit
MKYAAYESYMPSHSIWLDCLPAHWEQLRVKHVIERMESGVSVNADAAPAPIGEIGVLKTSCVYGDYFSPNENKRVLDEELGRVVCAVKSNRLIISRMNTPELVGSCGYVGQDFPNLYLPDRLWQTIFNSSKECLPRFAWYYLISCSAKSAISSLAAGTSGSMQNIAQDAFMGIIFPLPPFDEQQTIVHFLDVKTAQIDELITKKRQLIEKLKEKRQALIARTVTRGLPPEVAQAAGLEPNPEMKDSGFEWLGQIPATWKTVPLGYIVDMRGGATPDKNKPEYWDGEIPWVSPKDMKVARIFDAEDHISDEGLCNSPLSLIPQRALLIVVRGMILAHSFPVALSMRQLTINQDMKALVCSKAVQPEYMYWALCGFSAAFVASADESAHGTKKIESATLTRFPVLVPPFAEQQAITTYLDRKATQLDDLVFKVEKVIGRLTEYRQALITSAVTGKIDVRRLA